MSDQRLDEASVVFVQDSCGVNRERAVELLEAGTWSVERAVEIFLQGSTTNNTAGVKRKQPPTKGSPSKQASLKFFFGTKNGEETMSNDAPTRTTTGDTKNAPIAPAKKQAISSLKRADNNVVTDERLQYSALANAFVDMVATTKRLAKLDLLKTVLTGIVTALGGIDDTRDRIHDGSVLCRALELILGAGNIKLQVSGSAVSKAVIAVTGVSSSKLREAYRKTGDLGDAAELFMRNQQLLIEPKPLTIVDVHDILQQIASQEGKGSQNIRHTLMVKLLRSCKSHEIKFLVRTLLGNMRLGANVRTVLAALAMAIKDIEELDATTREADTAATVKAVQDTFDLCPRLDSISYALLCGGLTRMKETCIMQVGTPINPMLANPAHSMEEVQKLIMSSDGTSSRAAVAEWKYDGMRCQAHYDGKAMKLFSRHMLETTEQFPDAAKSILDARKDSATSFIIDSEIVGVEESLDEPGVFRLLPFQDLATRRGSGKESSIRIRVYAFDLMYLNGEPLVKVPLYRRQQMLLEGFRETSDFCFAQSMVLPAYNETVISEFLESAVKGGAEGLMVKLTGQELSNRNDKQISNIMTSSSEVATAVCPYESGVRTQTWLKLKRDYVAGDTIDVVPIGAWYGNGRKAQKKFFSPVLLAVYDEEEDVYRSISRCMSFTDAMYGAMRDFYLSGIPYPDGVGIAEDLGGTADNSEGAEFTSIAEEDMGMNSENPDHAAAADADADEQWVNCYPSCPSAVIVTNESPPIWFKPMEVFEVSFADLSLSKMHTAAQGLVDAERGVALRFPRFKRRRPDKRIDQATTCAEIAELFAKQTKQSKS